jgi:hypothetical protein
LRLVHFAAQPESSAQAVATAAERAGGGISRTDSKIARAPLSIDALVHGR